MTIGHLTIDEIRLGSSPPHEAPGGPSFYASLIASRFGVSTKVLSKVGADYPLDNLKILKANGIDTSLIKVTALPTTRFKLEYDERAGRSLRVLSVCEEIGLEDCLGLEGDWAVHIGPVVDEVSHDVYKSLSRRINFLSVDVQGIVRLIDEEEGRVSLKTPNDVSFLKGVRLVKATKEELLHLLGVKNITEAVKSFFRRIGRESLLALTLGKRGCLLLTSHEKFKAPAYPIREIGDPTGAGDVLIGGVISSILNGEDLDYALAVGVASASFCVEKTSVHNFSVSSDFEERIRWVYSRIRRGSLYPIFQ